MPQRASKTASIIDNRVASQPTTVRLGVPSGEGETRAWISTKTGREPSRPAKTTEPLARSLRSAKKSALGFATPDNPMPCIS